MLKIVTEINSGRIGKRSACIKYGLNRNTLALFIRKFSVRTLGEPLGSQLFHDMTEKQQIQLLEKKVRDLNKAIEHATLKSISLETLIKAAEQELHIRIRKSLVPSSQKNEAEPSKRKPGKALRTVWCIKTGILRRPGI